MGGNMTSAGAQVSMNVPSNSSAPSVPGKGSNPGEYKDMLKYLHGKNQQ